MSGGIVPSDVELDVEPLCLENNLLLPQDNGVDGERTNSTAAEKTTRWICRRHTYEVEQTALRREVNEEGC